MVTNQSAPVRWFSNLTKDEKSSQDEEFPAYDSVLEPSDYLKDLDMDDFESDEEEDPDTEESGNSTFSAEVKTTRVIYTNTGSQPIALGDGEELLPGRSTMKRPNKLAFYTKIRAIEVKNEVGESEV